MDLNKKLLLLIAICSLTVLIAGLFSELSLGDEAYHYRFAENIFKTGRRITFDPLYGSSNPPGYQYISEPFWHVLLVLLWKVIGRISFPAAQFYHTFYYALLVLFTYLLGKELYGQRTGFYSALIVATIPAIVAFSIVFYIDIPATCLSTLCFLLILKKRFFFAGIVLGLMYLTKRNSCFFVPAFIALIFYLTEGGIGKKVKNLLYFSLPALLIILLDILWRENNLSIKVIYDVGGKPITFENMGTLKGILRSLSLKYWDYKTKEYLNSSLLNPIDVVKYFGIVLLVGMAAYFLLKKHRIKDLKLWVTILVFFLFFSFVFYPGSDIRYLLPVFPLFAILSAVAIANLVNRAWVKYLMVFICLVQFGSTAIFLNNKRRISREIKEGFFYLRNNTSPDALIMYPEVILINATNRKFVWLGNLLTMIDNNFFWEEDSNKIKYFLKRNKIDYIAVKKSRIYDDSKRHHYGGYPISFVERLPKIPSLSLVFDNKEISIWQVK